MKDKPLVHDAPEPSPPLLSLGFLAGTFAGRGWFGPARREWKKRVRGWWAAGRRALVLEMSADYDTEDGRIDRHEALVVLWAEGDRCVGRIHTDAGLIREVRIDEVCGSFVFEEPLPHDSGAHAARKILRPRPDGYEDLLEIEDASGERTAWAGIVLKRLEAPG